MGVLAMRCSRARRRLRLLFPDEIRERNSLQITFIRDVALAGSVIFLFYCRRGAEPDLYGTTSF